MTLSADHHRPFGNTGLTVPPVIWSAAPLGNACRVIPDQVKLALCGEWLKHTAAPVFIDASLQHGNGLALEMLAAGLRELTVDSQEVVITSRLGWITPPPESQVDRTDPLVKLAVDEPAKRAMSYDDVLLSWQQTRQLLGDANQPRFTVLDVADLPGQAVSANGRARQIEQTVNQYRALTDLKSSNQVRGIGIATSDWRLAGQLCEQIPLDWVVLTSCLSIRQHPPELLALIERLHRERIAVVIASPFHGGFLVGGNRWDDRALDRENSADRTYFTWRTSVATLCEAHGITPLQAALQFDLAVSGVSAVLINTSHTERVIEIARAAAQPVPAAFWAAMKEEQLLAADYPHV